MKKDKRSLDWSQQQFRHVVLHLCYFGWDYSGLAMQADTGNTIENRLQDALRATSLIPPDAKLTDMGFTRAGRTDAGVSASKQIVSLYIRSRQKLPISAIGYTDKVSGFRAAPPPWQSEEKLSYNYLDNLDNLFLEDLDYIAAINSKLPPEIRILSWAPAPIFFNARFCADSRTYEYTIDKMNLDIDLMRIASQKFLGEHDFRNFCKMDLENANSFVRNIISLDIIEDQRSIVIRLVGSAFLWHQVRCMVAILLLVGQHHEDPEIIDELLDLSKYPSKPNYTMAADYPLCLVDTEYKNYNFGLSCTALNMGVLLIHCHREKALHLTKAMQWEAMINRHMDDSLLIRKGSDLTNSSDLYQENPIFNSSAFYPITLPTPTTKHQKIVSRPRDPSYEEKLEKRKNK